MLSILFLLLQNYYLALFDATTIYLSYFKTGSNLLVSPLFIWRVIIYHLILLWDQQSYFMMIVFFKSYFFFGFGLEVISNNQLGQ